jgi:translation initiation factor IF-2
MLAPEKREQSHRPGRSPPGLHHLQGRHDRGLLRARGDRRRNAQVRVLRNHVVCHTGELESLKRFKDDVKEVKFGYECGLQVRNFNDLQEGDQLEVFEIQEVARTL